MQSFVYSVSLCPEKWCGLAASSKHSFPPARHGRDLSHFCSGAQLKAALTLSAPHRARRGPGNENTDKARRGRQGHRATAAPGSFQGFLSPGTRSREASAVGMTPACPRQAGIDGKSTAGRRCHRSEGTGDPTGKRHRESHGKAARSRLPCPALPDLMSDTV